MTTAAFWNDYLHPASQSLDLVLDKTRTQESVTALRQDVVLPRVSELPWQHGSPAGPILLAAFHAYLSRISSQELITLGVQPHLLLKHTSALTTAEDDNQQQHPLVPLCCPPVTPEATLYSHAQGLQEELHLLLPHAHMSLPDICAAAGIQPASSMQHPLFQAGVVVASSVEAAAEAAAGLDLVLVLLPGEAALLYNTSIITPEGAQLMATHFQVYLEALLTISCDKPTPQPLLAAPLMDDTEQQLVLRDFNATDLEYDRQAFVHGLFMARAQDTPNAACVVFEDYVFTYAEIDAASNRIANYLIDQAGVSPGDIVAVLLLRSPLMIATLLAVLKAGAGYLPLDHHHPEARITFMLEDAAVKAVIVSPDLLSKLPDAPALSSLNINTLLLQPQVPFITKGKQPKPARGGSAGAAFPPVIPAALAATSFGPAAASSPAWSHGQLGSPSTTCYIIYTSGSTGKPKGVVVMHQGLTAYIAWFRAYFGITAADVFIQKTPTNFDASMDELWPSLTAGAQLVVTPPEAHRDVHSVMMLVTRHLVTTSSAVPSQLQALAREILSLHDPEAAAAGQAPCSSLKRVLSGGEALTSTMAQDINTAMPNCKLYNTYGPTETTVGITAWLYQPPTSSSTPGTATPAAATIPIGSGIHNARLYVVDASLKPVPVGVPGELYLSGVQVAWGYLNRPDLNDKTFVPNPFCEGPGTHTERMYKAGDLVRWLPGRHGCLEFLGRVDHQVKLRGFRIELQEIEAALGALPGVSQVATALAKNPTTQQDQLVAWISPAELDTQDLVQQLHGSLPEYMIPTVVVCMQQLPLLPSEKVNRKALPAPDFARHAVKPPVKTPTKPAAGQAAGHTPAANTTTNTTSSGSSSSSSGGSSRSSSPDPTGRIDPLLQHVCRVWSDVLGVGSDGITPLSDFFALGGNSLLCGKMNSRIRAELNAPGLSGMLIYQNTTLAEFAQAVAVAGAALPAASSGSTAATTTTTSGVDSTCGLSSVPSSDEIEEVGGSCSDDLSDLQQYIAEAWGEALGVDAASLSAEADFFARGGNSLLCGKMNSRIRSGLDLPSMSGMLIYQHPTLAAFTEAVAASGALVPPAYHSSSSSSSTDGPSALLDDSTDVPPIGRYGSSSSSTAGPVDTILDEDALSRFVAAAWAATLGVDNSSLAGESDFFSLGGNSLLCGRMNSRLRVGLNLPGLSGMLICQNTTLEAFTNAVAQAGPSLPCNTSTCSGLSRGVRSNLDSSFTSNSSCSFRPSNAPPASRVSSVSSSNAPPASRVSSVSSSFSGFSGYSSSWTTGGSSYSGSSTSRSGSSQGGAASSIASAAVQAAAAAFRQDQSSAAGRSDAEWSIGSTSYEQSLATASQAAYAAATAAYTTVMATLGLELNGPAAPSSSSSASTDSKTRLGSKGSGSLFSKHFRAGAGAAGGSAVPVYDAHMQELPSVPSFALSASAGKGSAKPTLLDRQLPGDKDVQEEGVAASATQDQVVTSATLCTFLQILVGMCITGFTQLLTVLPLLGWMWLLAFWGFKAIAIMPALTLASLVLGVSFSILGKWVYIGRYKEGEHPIWGWQYLSHWLASQFVVGARQTFLPLIKRTTLVNWFYRSLGMNVGNNVMIDTDDFLGYDLIDIKDDAVLDVYCGVTAVTFEAGKPYDKFPSGKMIIKRASVGKGAVVGAQGMVVCADVADGAVVQPCSASNNPPAAWKGTRWPQTGPEAVVAARTQDKPLGVLSGLLALSIIDVVMAIVSYPFVLGMLFLWTWLSGYSSAADLPVAAGDALQCFVQLPGHPLSAVASAKCSNLLLAAIKTGLLSPATAFITGQLLVLVVIPLKWLVRGHVKADAALSLTATPKTWLQRFRSHLLRVLLDHPALKVYLFMWTGTAMFNAWLRAMGSKVGRQAWIGEGLQLFDHDLVEIGDSVSVCSDVSLMPSSAMGSRKITIKGGADVTNQTAVYPGVTVMPGACLGVFTYAEPGRTFPRDSIVQGPMVLMPGRPEPEEGGPPVDSDPAIDRRVSTWQYAKFNTLYTLLMVFILLVAVTCATMPLYLALLTITFKAGIVWLVLVVPFASMAALGAEILWMVLVKKTLLRRCKGNNPFYQYTHTAWMITGILFYFHQINLLKKISGSQMVVWYYRAMGANIGKGVLVNSLSSNEPDCLTIGDGTVIDDLSFVMAHTVENRCVKFHDVHIGNRVTIGCGSAVMPGVEINDDAVIGDVSIVMKGESVPSGAVWRGVPAVPVIDQA